MFLKKEIHKMATATLTFALALCAGSDYLTPQQPLDYGDDNEVIESRELADLPGEAFAEIDKNGEVVQVIIVSQEEINTGKWGDPTKWKKTSKDNYAGKGNDYVEAVDLFVAKKPDADAVYDTVHKKWKEDTIKTKASSTKDIAI